MSSVSAKLFAVTGGASGIRAATCRLLAERGACGYSQSPKSNASALVQCTKVDVSSVQEVNLWLHGIVSKHGDLHGAAKVAGMAQAAGLRTTLTVLGEDDAERRRVLDVNLNGVFYSTRAEVKSHEGFAARPSQHRQRGQHCRLLPCAGCLRLRHFQECLCLPDDMYRS
ncbi:hypothetical protein E4U43_005920 [Claviceps pusilla]|uniref:Uncharacterized protein n=1 Tax=Claviceps pusilla TaxID=123648 RepID=A0A9P7N3Y8_9HYPO|nr:hypothetical protein E4U43_005920 [Claviceps pusilla]